MDSSIIVWEKLFTSNTSLVGTRLNIRFNFYQRTVEWFKDKILHYTTSTTGYFLAKFAQAEATLSFVIDNIDSLPFEEAQAMYNEIAKHTSTINEAYKLKNYLILEENPSILQSSLLSLMNTFIRFIKLLEKKIADYHWDNQTDEYQNWVLEQCKEENLIPVYDINELFED